MTNYIEAEDFTPNPINLLQSNRNLGYSIEEAVSDLIDNSLSANATNIDYNLIWNQGNPFFVLTDDGDGMSISSGKLINSFKLGSQNPLDERDPNDLGRFGFGMKTASLSQSNSLIVLSKVEGGIVESRALDLNFLTKNNNGWKLRKVESKECLGYDDKLNDLKSGTVIIWNDWDRAPKKREDFLNLNERIYNYLSVCFHRFIETGVNISSNSMAIQACSPIPAGEGAEEYSRISLKSNSKATQKAYVLQHPSKWKEDYESSLNINSFRLFEGFERQQGIYIYRCNRLLTPRGGWLGVLKRGNSAKLARVVIDYPNDADSLWSLDITKTNAIIPYEFLNEIKSFVIKTRQASNSKIVRGIKKKKESLNYKDAHVWEEHKDIKSNALRYRVNTNHRLFKTLVKENKIDIKQLNLIADLVSETLPIYKIIANNDEDPSQHDKVQPQSKLSKTELQIAKIIYKDELMNFTKNQAISYVLSQEPFCYHEDQLRKYLNE